MKILSILRKREQKLPRTIGLEEIKVSLRNFILDNILYKEKISRIFVTIPIEDLFNW